MLCKQLARHMVLSLPKVLAQSKGLRYAASPHVRSFAAQAFGFLLRQVCTTFLHVFIVYHSDDGGNVHGPG